MKTNDSFRTAWSDSKDVGSKLPHVQHTPVQSLNATSDSEAKYCSKPNNNSQDTDAVNCVQGKKTTGESLHTHTAGLSSLSDIGQQPPSNVIKSGSDIPERVFMNGLLKHTGIALALIISLAAWSAYATPTPLHEGMVRAKSDQNTTSFSAIEPSTIIHASANLPTPVTNVDLKKYTGQWYEIGRLPMYFQRNCAKDVTATYTEKTDSSGILVLNTCVDKAGKSITAKGLATPTDATNSKLKVTFLPTWLRWLPLGQADYWVLARDSNYKTALVGTPDHKYLWLLARSPNITEATYAKYRQIAQQQGYHLKAFKLTPQTNQTVKLIP